MPSKKDDLIHAIRNTGVEAVREARRAELDDILLRELRDELRSASTTILVGMGDLADGIAKHRTQMADAAAAASKGSDQLAALTLALVTATNRYVLLTGGLLVVASVALLFQIAQWWWR